MIIKERKKVSFERNVITDVICDNCGKSINEDDYVHRVKISTLYFIKGLEYLEESDFYDYCLDLCDECIKPIEELIRNIERKMNNRGR